MAPLTPLAMPVRVVFGAGRARIEKFFVRVTEC